MTPPAAGSSYGMKMTLLSFGNIVLLKEKGWGEGMTGVPFGMELTSLHILYIHKSKSLNSLGTHKEPTTQQRERPCYGLAPGWVLHG